MPVPLRKIAIFSLLLALSVLFTVAASGAAPLAPDTDTIWEQVSTLQNPGPRYIHGMAYDSARQVSVLFGGDGNGRERRNDTWEYDGSAWVQLQPAQSPSGRVNIQGAMVFDSQRNRTVLFGGLSATGYMSDTWEYDGATWTQRTPSVSPPGRDSHAMVYDPVRRVIVLFGGYSGNPSNLYLNDTWEFNGSSWQQVSTPQSPTGRNHHAMAYDSQRRVVVLYGGRSAADPQLDDTWEYNGLTWTQVSPAGSPGERESHAMAYDAERRVTVLFGGTADGSAPLGDTWEYDGVSWIPASTVFHPSARFAFPMVYDNNRDKIALYGGGYGDGRFTILGETWEFDEDVGTWSAIVQSARLDIGMPYDTDRGCPTPYTGCGGPFHGFYAGVNTDIVLDAYEFGAALDLQQALSADHLANPGRYQYGTSRYAEDLRRYFGYAQQVYLHSEPYLKGDVAFFDWENDGTIDHSAVISQVDGAGRPQWLVHAPGYTAANLSGKSLETGWSSFYEDYVKSHGRIGSPLLQEPDTTTATLQVLRINLDSPAVTWRLQDENGRHFSEVYDENLVASNIKAFIPYIPGASYTDLGSATVITLTQPLDNADRYSLELTALASATYTLDIATLQDGAHTQGSPVTVIQPIASGATHRINIELELRQGEIRFKSTPVANPAPLVAAPDHLELTATTGSTAQLAFVIQELGGLLSLSNATLTATELKGQLGGAISAARLNLSPGAFSISPGASQSVLLSVDLDGIAPGLYQGSIRLASANIYPLNIPLTVFVEPYRRYVPLLIRN
jgi:hypothetical protein